MPLARYALYAQDIDIFVSPTWDTSDTWLASMHHIAMEGGCWVIAGPLNKEKGILYAEIERGTARRARRSLDVCGHYARADILSLSVDRRPLDPVKFSD